MIDVDQDNFLMPTGESCAVIWDMAENQESRNMVRDK